MSLVTSFSLVRAEDFSQMKYKDLNVRRQCFSSLVEKGNTHKVSEWLEHGWSPNYVVATNGGEHSSNLGLAVKHENLNMILTLLESRCSRYRAHVEEPILKEIVCCCRASGTPFQKSKQFRMLALLLKAGLTESHHPNLYLRCYTNLNLEEKCRLSQGLCRQSSWNVTALYVAAEFGFSEMFIYYSKNFDWNKCPDIYFQSLSLAVQNWRSKEVVKFLVNQNGDSIFHMFDGQKSPAQWAFDVRNADVLDFFESKVGREKLLEHLGIQVS